MNTPETGRQQLNRQLVEGAANLSGPAADLASGAGLIKTTTNFLKGAMLDKLLGPTAIFAGGLVGVLRTVRSIVRESGILEKGLKRIASVQGITGQFETLLKSATAAKKRIEELYRFTAGSPFDFRDVAEANRILEALTRGAFSGAKAMQLVGDMAAATGSNMSTAAEKVAKLYAALASGRSLDKIIFQLQMSGVVTDELAGKLEFLESSGATFASKWSEVEKVLGRTSGGMKNEIENLDALRTRLDNANAAMAQAFAEPYVEAQVKAMKLMIGATENLTPLVAEIGRDFSVIPNFIRDFKNSLLDTFAASKGFAESLKIAYKVAVSLFAGLSGATLVMAARNLAGIGSAALSTAQSLRTAYSATLAAAKAQAALATATALSADATKAFTSGSLLSAAALKAESFWLSTKTRALALNTAAARLAGAGTAAYSISAHAANLATGALAGGVKLASKGLGLLFGILRGSAVAFATNPWTAAAFAIVTAAAALYKWSASAREAAKNAKELAAHMADTTRRLTEQASAVKSLTEWQDAVAKLGSEYDELTAKVMAFNRRVAQGEDVSSDDIAANAKNVSDWRKVRAARDKMGRRSTAGLDLSDPERENIRADQAAQRAKKDQAFRIALGNAQTPEAKLEMMEARAADLESRISDGKAAKAQEKEAVRNGSAQRRLELENARKDLENRFDQQETGITDRRDAAMKKAGAGTVAARDIWQEAEKELRALRARRGVAVGDAEARIRDEDMQSKSPTVRLQAQLDNAVRTGAGPDKIEALTRALDDAKASVAGLADAEAELAEITAQSEAEARELKNTRGQQRVGNWYDEQINGAKKSGKPTGGLEFDKALAMAEVERNQAKAPEDVQAAQNKIDAMLAEREAGRREVETERKRNAALVSGDRKGAQAIDDAAALREQINRYDGLGLSKDQATADFQRSIMAQAAGQAPNIVASSMQSIGGGGRAYQGQDPVLAAQQRSMRAQEQAAKDVAESRKILGDIRDLLGEE